MAKRNLDNYVPVNVRVMQARTKYGDDLGILTEVKIFPEQGVAYIIAAIVVGNRKLANGHAMTTDLNDEKAIEKAESSAVGRALAFAGFSADSAIASAEDMADVIQDTVSEPDSLPEATVASKRFTPKPTGLVTGVSETRELSTPEDFDTGEEESIPETLPKPAVRPNVLAKFKKPNVPPSLAGGNKAGGR